MTTLRRSGHFERTLDLWRRNLSQEQVVA
jgi:hypothetical protein